MIEKSRKTGRDEEKAEVDLRGWLGPGRWAWLELLVRIMNRFGFKGVIWPLIWPKLRLRLRIWFWVGKTPG